MINKKTILIAHRGLWKSSLENTVQAFELGVQKNISYFETDLRHTLDGKIVLSHDPSFKRQGSSDTLLSTLSVDEIKKISLQGSFSPCFLDDIYPRFKNCKWIWDLKPEGGIKTIDCLFNWVKENSAQEWITENVWFLLWSSAQEKYLKNKFPQVTCLVRKNACWQAGLSVFLNFPALGNIKKGGIYGLIPSLFGKNLYDKKIVDFYKDRGAQVIAYLPKNKKELLLPEQAGIEKILVDYDSAWFS